MCGISGLLVAGNRNLMQYERHIKILLSVVSDRGNESTGLAIISNDGSYRTVKTLSPGFEVARNIRMTDVFSPRDIGVLIHGRYATTGEVTVDNSHPFSFSRTVGVHNGVIHNWKDLVPKEKENEFKVDSSIIFYLLEQTRNNYKAVFKKLSGNITTAWYNANSPSKIYMSVFNNPLSLLLADGVAAFGSYETYLLAIAPFLHNPLVRICKDDSFYSFSRKNNGTITAARIAGSLKYSTAGNVVYGYGYSQGGTCQTRHKAGKAFVYDDDAPTAPAVAATKTNTTATTASVKICMICGSNDNLAELSLDNTELCNECVKRWSLSSLISRQTNVSQLQLPYNGA